MATSQTPSDRPRADPGRPDYELEETLAVSDTAGLRAIADGLRGRILGLLLERAATTSELARSLGRPKGTVGYHMKVLERAGLVRVVRTEQVRAVTAKYYGRTARTFLVSTPLAGGVDPFFMMREAMREAVSDSSDLTTLRHARIPRERAREWGVRLAELAREFRDQDATGDEVYGLLISLYLTDWQALPERKPR